MKENLYEKLLQDISKLFLIFQLKKLINYTRLNKKEELFIEDGFYKSAFFFEQIFSFKVASIIYIC